MEAARRPPDQLAERRSRRFTAECEELRPQGVAFVLGRYGHTLDHADAEDAVAEVIIRLHRHAQAGRAPDNLRAAFFAAVRNAAIDQLRSRGARPTVPLEAVAEAPTPVPSPQEQAEAGDELVRLREALARMRPNYREAIVLRFGVDLSVPEISERLRISLPAAKKLVLRSTNQIRERMESITGAEFCPQMREHAERSLFDREAAGLAEESERAALEAHFEHCGSCRTFLAALRGNLHELGSGALLGGYAARHSGVLHHLGTLADRLLGAGRAASAKARLAAYKVTGALQPGDAGAPGALAGTAQKVAAVCTAGAATTATCLATGIVGPGLAVTHAPPPQHQRPPAKVRTVSTDQAGASTVNVVPPPPPTPASSEEPAETQASHATARPNPVHRSKQVASASEPTPSPSEQTAEDFGFEGETPSSTPSTPAAPSATASSAESTPSPSPPPASPAPSSSSSSSSGGGTEHYGFSG